MRNTAITGDSVRLFPQLYCVKTSGSASLARVSIAIARGYLSASYKYVRQMPETRT